MKSLKTILENPPQKKVKCSRCCGRGYINPRGMVSSDPCPNCGNGDYGGNTGKEYVTDFDEWVKIVKRRFKYDTKRTKDRKL